jgi:hypothetical protein
MEQMIPNISDADIKRITKRDFPQFDFAVIASILKVYKSESKQGENRIHASVLKLANGNIETLQEYIVKANSDYRDILALSEYPNYSEIAFEQKLSDDKKEGIIRQDWMQYQAWLNKG